MRLDRKEIVAGQPIKRVREFLRTYRDGRPDLDSVAEFFETKPDDAMVVAAAMVERNLIAPAPPDKWDLSPVVYTVTDLGVRLAAASLLNPIPRAKADRIVSDLLTRVANINARDDLTHFVGEVRAFGSYITASPDVADIDLAISFVAKPTPNGTELTDWHLQRARQSGRVLSTYIERLCYSEREVRQLIKGRNQYVSIHAMSELDQLKVESRPLYTSPERPRYAPPERL